MVEKTPSASDMVLSFLRDKDSQDVFAVATEEGNAMATEGFGKDLREMTQLQLSAKYGRDVADNRHRILDGDQRLQNHQQRDSSFTQKVGDTILDAGSAFTGMAGSVGHLAARPLAWAAGVDADQASVHVAGLTNAIQEGLTETRSDFANEDARWQAIKTELDQADNAKQMAKDLAEGATPFTAKLQSIGRGVLDGLENASGESVRAIIGGSLGSLAPSAALAKGAQMAAAKGVGMLTKSARASALASSSAALASIGGTEAAGTYADTINEVMDMDADTLSASPVYAGLLEEGYNPYEAKVALANMTAEEAFARNLPAAIALGVLTKKFEVAPIGSFKGAGIIGSLRTITAQGLEEGGQGAASGLSQNLAIRNQVDETRDVTEGVGQQIAEGMIGGVGQAAVSAAPAAATGAIRETVKAGVDASVSKTFDDPLNQEIMGRDNLAARAKDAAKALAQPVVDRATQEVDRKGQSKAVEQARESVAAVEQEVLATEDATPEAKELVTEADQSKVSSGFRKEAAKGETFMQRVARVTEKLADKRMKVSDADTAFAADQYGKLRTKLSSLPKKAAQKAIQILESPQAKAVNKRFSELDQNKKKVDLTKPVDEDTVVETIAIARNNPTNVNPEVADKILKESRENLTDEEVKIMEGASKIATTVNKYQDTQIEIDTTRNVGLTKKQLPQKKIRSKDDVSRSLLVLGYEDKRTGKPLRSIGQFASDIMLGAQTKDGKIFNEEGQPVSVDKVMGQFSNLVRHMTNKVGALNESYKQNNAQGNGPSLAYEGLVSADKFIPADQWKGAKVFYHRANPNSVHQARQIASDANAAIEVYNTLIDTFPEKFGKLKKAEPIVLLEDKGSHIDLKELEAEMAAQEKQEIYEANQKAYERRIRKDAFLKTEESLIEQEPKTKKKKPTVPEDKAASAALDEQNQQAKKKKKTKTTDATSTSDDGSLVDDGDSFDDVNTSDPVDTGTGDNEGEAEAAKKNVHESFHEAYVPVAEEAPFSNLDEYVTKARQSNTMNQITVGFANKIVKPLVVSMNKRLTRSVTIDGKKMPLNEAIKQGLVQTFSQYRNTAIVDPETGKYDQDLMELAGIALVDWLMTAQARDINQLDDTLAELELNYADLTDDELRTIMYGIPTPYAKDQIARNILKMWNVEENLDRPMIEIAGIAEGIAAEFLTVLHGGNKYDDKTGEKIKDGLIEVAELTLSTGFTTQSILVDGLDKIQQQAKSLNGEGMNLTASETFFDEPRTTYSIGTKLTHTAVQQNRSNVKLTGLQRKATKTMQDTGHFKDESRADVALALGPDALARISGFVEDEETIGNKTLARSVRGKNLGIKRNIQDAMTLLGLVKDGETPVYYPVGITSVGRHQYQGPNPQSNKWIRALVTPTWSTLSLESKEDMDLFWLGIAQAADLFKVEKNNHMDVLAQVQKKFNDKYRPAVDMIKAYHETGEIDGDAFADAIGVVEPQVFAAIQSVAHMEAHVEAGATEFKTSLSFELDGLTNGAANMMVNYGQGQITQKDLNNFNRIGFFLGKVGKNINDYFSARDSNGNKNRDLYEQTSMVSQSNMYNPFMVKKGFPTKRMKAAARFAERFGDFEKIGDQIQMTRNTAKNPMTKVNYGSSVSGVGNGIADDMVIEFYRKAQGIPNKVSLAQYFGYPDIEADMALLFGKAPKNLQGGAFEFDQESMEKFRKNISQSVGKVLTESTKSVIGDKITELNDMLVFSTNVQSKYLQLIFDKKLYDLAKQRVDEGKLRTHPKTGEPIMTEMTKRDYNSVVREMEKLSPIFKSDDQTLAMGGFERKIGNMVLSRNMDGKLNQKALVQRPDDVGVRAIPYSVIGSGDAMMMNLIFGSDDMPESVKKMLGIFDGLDVPVSEIKNIAPYVNQQVLRSWERDVLAMAVNNFEEFVKAVGENDPFLQEAFAQVRDANKKKSLHVQSIGDILTDLRERHRQNKARKAVFKRIPLSVDQMGGSSVGYTRGEGEMSLQEINREIQKELDGKVDTPKENNKVPTSILSASAVLKSLKMTSEQQKVAKILAPMLDGITVVLGSLEQVNDYRQREYPDDAQVITSKGSYDPQHGVIYLTTKTASTVLHEMVHAATYGKVKEHYTGEQRSEAVERLEALMREFLDLDISGARLNETKAAILRHRAKNDPASKASALNEFMAYALTQAETKKKLKNTETQTLKDLGKKVLQLMRKLMGGVPTSMFDHVVFNTKLLNDGPPDFGGNGNDGDGGGNDGGDGDGSGGENTPEARGFTNFWIETLKTYLDEKADAAKNLRDSAKPTLRLIKETEKVVEGFRQVGMLANNEARQTFKAIYMVVNSELKLNENSVLALSKVFDHIEEHLSPEMFGKGSEANQEYSAVMNAFDAKKDGKSDALAVLIALSQTSAKFRKALEQIPDPQGEAQVDGSLNQLLTKFGQMLMGKVMDTLDTEDKKVQQVLNELADGLVNLDKEREYKALRIISGTFDKADKFTSGMMSTMSNKMREKNEKIKEESRFKFVKALSSAVTLGTNLLDKENSEASAMGLKQLTHMSVPVLSLVPIRELVSEIIGTDRFNEALVALQDVVNYKISGMRQAYREDLPVILERQFKEPPTVEQWASMHTVLGQMDFTKFINPRKMQQGMQMLEESARRKTRIQELEKTLKSAYVPYVAQDAMDKAQQLANFMNKKGAGKLLLRNAYAITKNLDGKYREDMIEVIDELTTMYAVDQMDPDIREATVQMWQNDPKAITAMVTYIQGLNQAEDNKLGITEQARLNAYKGFIPNHGDKDTRIVIEATSKQFEMEKRGYTLISEYTGDPYSMVPKSYYVTTSSLGGAYSQGIMQNVHTTYRGVDMNTGMTVTGETAGYISADDGVVDEIIKDMNDVNYTLQDDKETLLPVFDDDGAVAGFERAINPDIYAQHMRQDENLAQMLGAWAGRHVEEALAYEYNRTLLDHLDKLYKEREAGEDDLYVNLKTTKDPIYREAFKLWPQSIKNYADGLFDGEGPMVRKDQVNLATGYREFSPSDLWTGKTRLPKELAHTIRNVSQIIIGKDALKALSTGQKITHGAVSSAKDIIVIRSLIVPALNTAANVVQLAQNGVPLKMIVQGYRRKLAEASKFNEIRTKIIELEAELGLKANSPNQKRIIESKIAALNDLKSRMSIAPMIEAGQYKMLSEGLTELDAQITKGRLNDIVENVADKYLPNKLNKLAKLGIVSKSTKVYKVANRATQYGDFLAKSIYYDHLIAQGKSEEEAIAAIGQEFVNFSTHPGRVRSGAEMAGLSWFMAFKIRIIKIAMRQIRDNPVRALAVNNLLPDVGSPINDNFVSVMVDGRLDYATGMEMLLDAPAMLPWYNLLDG